MKKSEYALEALMNEIHHFQISYPDTKQAHVDMFVSGIEIISVDVVSRAKKRYAESSNYWAVYEYYKTKYHSLQNVCKCDLTQSPRIYMRFVDFLKNMLNEVLPISDE